MIFPSSLDMFPLLGSHIIHGIVLSNTLIQFLTYSERPDFTSRANSKSNGLLEESIIVQLIRTIWNLEVNYSVYKSSPMSFILSQMNPIYVLPSQIYINISSYLRPELSNGLLSSDFLPKFCINSSSFSRMLRIPPIPS